MEKAKRIGLLDEWRGFLVILMVFFHSFYTGGYLFHWTALQKLYLFFYPLEPLFAGMFIFLCGICCHFSHSNLKRGLLLLGIAIALSLVLWWLFPDNLIVFGILHFLAVAILLYALLEKLLRKIPIFIGLIGCSLLTLLTWCVPFDKGFTLGIPGLFSWPLPVSLQSHLILYPLGLGAMNSADYFPLIPWIFVFWGGSFLGRWIKNHVLPSWMMKTHVPLLSTIGKMALPMYLLHQPVIFGLFWLVELFH
ncbi:MAG: DUF1624 domain-containing protein [Clostridia bacterium]|nr:DUF1624 domain-containing protein [Clostridia bacterium]